jgi:hypothetical protein
MEVCEKHGPYSTMCRECDIEDLLSAGVECYGFTFDSALKITKRPIVFHYSAYWRTWSRLLKNVIPGEPHGYVELDLSPLNGNWDGPDGQRVQRINIRKHTTQRDAKDRDVHVLPDNIRQALFETVGESKAAFMLHHEFMDDIDWEVANRICNGGFPYLMARKREAA